MNQAVLGIDTSCYTTSVALASEGKILASERKLLSVPLGQCGLRQNEAVFQHIRQLPDLLENLFSGREIQIGAICVSKKPADAEDSYMPVFQTGFSFAGAIGTANAVPVFSTTHQRGHIRAALIDSLIPVGQPFLCVHLSGGTTDVLCVREGNVLPLGKSTDLHAGQLVDRIAVQMGASFPGGSFLEKLCEGDAGTGTVPISVKEESCSFSGAEAHLKRMLKDGCDQREVAAETYSVLIRTVLRVLQNAAEKTGLRTALLMGGIASSGTFRNGISERNIRKRLGLDLKFGKPEYSGDNACGVALIGDERMREPQWKL